MDTHPGEIDCKKCHDDYSINFSIMNSSSAGHKNLNSDASATVDPENKKCWACHVDGTQPTNQHPFGTPKTCIECHTGAGLMGAPIVHEHTQVGDEIRTTPDCSSCHNNTDMFIPYGAGADMLSHYVKKVTNMATAPYEHLGPINTSDCLNCHAGPNSGNPDWGSPVSIIHNPNHPVAPSNAECDRCHNDGTILSLTNVDFHDKAIRPVGGDNCLECHSSAQ